MLLLLAVQPGVDAALLDRLIALRCGEGHELAASHYGGEPGVPAIFAPRFARELVGLAGDRGAKALLLRESARVALVPFADGALDVDTPDDWTRVSRIFG